MLAPLGRHVRQQYAGFLALFVALGGVSYAAITLPANSVGSKQIKRGAVKNSDLGKNGVTTGKVKNGSLLSVDFKAGQLPAGPQGLKGDPGAPGTDGAPGTPGNPGAPGSARAYGRVAGNGALTRSANATVRRAAVGKYCITVPGVTPTQTTALASTDGNGSGGGDFVDAYSAETTYCNSGEFAILGQKYSLCGGSPPTAICQTFADIPFTFVVP